MTPSERAREIALSHAVFPDGRPVYGPVWCDQLTNPIARAAVAKKDVK